MNLDTWPKSSIPIKIYEELSDSPCYRKSYSKQLKLSLDEWTKASKGVISFTFVKDESEADIVWQWKEALPEEIKARSEKLAFTGRSPNDGGIKHCLVIILINEKPDDALIKSVCLHETGHALGLEHSLSQDDIMRSSFDTIIEKKTKRLILTKNISVSRIHLSQRDVNSLNRLYEEREEIREQQLLDDGKNLGGDPEGYNIAGVRTMNQQKFEKALSHYQNALKIDASFRPAGKNMALCYLRWGSQARRSKDYLEAAARYEKSIHLMEKYDPVHLPLGIEALIDCLLTSGNDRQAKEWTAKLKLLNKQ